MREVIEPGELANIVIKMRELLSSYRTIDFVIKGSLEAIDPRVEDLAATLRPQLHDTANGLYELLDRLEALPAYVQLRKEYLTS